VPPRWHCLADQTLLSPRHEPIVFRAHTPREAELVRLAARGCRLSVSDFVRAAVLRAACEVRRSLPLPSDLDQCLDALPDKADAIAATPPIATTLNAPGESDQIVAQVRWDIEEKFRGVIKRNETLWLKPSPEEHDALQAFKVAIGDIVHGKTPPDVIGGNRMLDQVRELAWRVDANRIYRKKGLPQIPLPTGSARIDDGVLTLSIGALRVGVRLGPRNRKTYPGPGVFHHAILEQFAGSRWELRFAAYEALSAAPIKKARPAR
jgi:hypothetical protein